jgi:hypothetical protein
MLPKLLVENSPYLNERYGMGSCEPPKPANEEIGVNPTLNAGSFAL